jgi:hypothetical protein
MSFRRKEEYKWEMRKRGLWGRCFIIKLFGVGLRYTQS